MRVSLALSLALTFFTSLASAIDQDRAADILVWPLSAAKPQTLAKVSFTSTNASVKSYTAPASSLSTADDIYRIGFYHSSGQWSGIATSASNFASGKAKTLLLHVKTDGELYHVGFRATEGGTSQGQGASASDELSVEVVKIRPGPVPHLNKPVVLDAEGNEREKEPEKNFLQKYWWAIALFLLLQIVAGGGGKE